MGFQSYNPVGSPNQGQARPGTPILGQPPPAAPAAPAPAQPPPFTQTKVPYASNTPGFSPGSGASPAYGSQSPNFLGTGQYVAPLFPINDQAITGNPQQNAGGNYGLNTVWNALQNEVARSQGPGPMSMVTAPQGQSASYQAALGNATLANAAQGGYATAAPTGLSTAGNTLGRQGSLADLLTAQAAGGGAPSAADLQLRQGEQQALGAQLAAMGSQRGVTNAALMNRNAADQAAAGQANLNAQMGIQRAQESQAAQQALGGVLSAQGAQAAGINQTAAQLAQQNNQFNAANAENAMLANTGYAQQAALANQAAQNAMTGGNLSALNAANLGNAQLGQQMGMSNLGYQNQDVLANQAAQLANAQFQNQSLNAALGAQTGIGEANRAAAAADQQMQVQQMIAANQVNEQAYQAAANANANLTGAVISGVTGLGSAGLNALNNGGGAGSWTGPAPEGAGAASGITGTASDGTWNATVNRPGYGNGYAYSDENLKSGIEGGNPMMRSFLENYRKSTEPKIDIAEGERFRNPTYGRAPGASSGGGGGIGSAIGGFLGGLAGSFVAPGIGTAVGAGAGSQIGGAIGNGVDPGSASGGGMVQTSQGSGVTADDLNQDYSAVSDKKEKTEVKEVGPATVQKALAELKADPKYSVLFGEGRQNFNADSMEQNAMDNADPDAPPSYGYIPQYPGQGWEKGPAPSDYNFFRSPSPLNVQSAQAMMQPPAPLTAPLPMAALRSAYPQLTAAVSDESEKEAVTSGNRGMQAFLSQANAQTQAQNNNAAQSNAFMASSLPPQAQVDTQMPSTSYGGGLPPFAQQGGAVGYGSPQGPQGGNIYGGGISNYGGYQGGGVMPQYMPSSAAADASLAMAHPQTSGMQGPGAVTWSPAAYSQIGADALAQQAGAARYQPMPASNINRPGVVLSDEEQKVKTNRGAGLQDMLDQLHAYQYRYKDTSLPGTMPGKRLGVMAQDLEKSPVGKQFVREDPQGHKLVDYGSMAGTQLAASAMLNDRLNQHEEMLKALSKRAA